MYEGMKMTGDIYTPDQLDKAIEQIKLSRFTYRVTKLVATCGCFDLLHAGHILYLQEARKSGNMLIVFLNSDDSVRRLKGENRPICNINDRAVLLASLRAVDAVIIFDEDKPLKLLDAIKPDVWVKGGDYTRWTADQEECRLVESNGGKVDFIAVGVDDSTTKLIERLKTLHVPA